MRDGMHDWVVANENMARVLAAKGYHYQFTFARNAGHTDRTPTANVAGSAGILVVGLSDDRRSRQTSGAQTPASFNIIRTDKSVPLQNRWQGNPQGNRRSFTALRSVQDDSAWGEAGIAAHFS